VNGGAPAEPKTPEKRVNPIKLRQMQDRRSELEAEVSRSEAEITDLEAALSNFISVEETVRQNDLLTARRARLEKLLAEWEEVVQAIEANA
jgi:ATP-binding cassette subfamily F protein 3